MRTIKFTISLLTSFFFLFSCVNAGITKTVESKFKAKNGGTLSVEIEKAAVYVKTHNNESIESKFIYDVDGDEELASELIENYKVKFNDDGTNLEIEADYIGNSNKIKIKLEVTIPENYNVDIKTSGGSIYLDDLNGTAEAKTSGGSIKFGRISGNVIGKTSGGSIEVSDSNGDVVAKTSGGGITISKCNGSAEAYTSGGSIKIEEAHGTVNAKTSGGSIFAQLVADPKEDCSLSTSGGGITIELSKKINAYIDAKTSGGSVSTDFPVRVKGTMKRNELKGEINSGGPKLLLRTSGGRIQIREI